MFILFFLANFNLRDFNLRSYAAVPNLPVDQFVPKRFWLSTHSYKINPMQQVNPQDVLREILRRMYKDSKSRNLSFSLRSFARQLQVSPSVVSEILSGKRSVSREYAEKIFSRLNLRETEWNQLQSTFVFLPNSRF